MGGSAKYRYSKKVAKINADPNLSDWERDIMLQDADMVYQEQRRRELERKASTTDINVTKRSEKLEKFQKASDDEKAEIFYNAIDRDMDELPESLRFPQGVASDTQKLVYGLDMNDKPTVLSSKEFDDYLKNNNVSDGDILTRSVNEEAEFTLTNWMNDDLTYISGRNGGDTYGQGMYFSHNFGRPTGYGGTGAKTIRAVFKPDAKVIRYEDIAEVYKQLPEPIREYVYNRTRGDFVSLIAALSGYDAIVSSNGYTCIINRNAVIVDSGIF